MPADARSLCDVKLPQNGATLYPVESGLGIGGRCQAILSIGRFLGRNLLPSVFISELIMISPERVRIQN